MCLVVDLVALQRRLERVRWMMDASTESRQAECTFRDLDASCVVRLLAARLGGAEGSALRSYSYGCRSGGLLARERSTGASVTTAKASRVVDAERARRTIAVAGD